VFEVEIANVETACSNRRMITGRVLRFAVVALLIGISSRSACGQTVALIVKGEVKTPLKLTMQDLQVMPAAKINVTDHDGTTATYEGVWLNEILRRADLPSGESLRGPALQLSVLVKAADNYRVVFSLAELDPMFGNKQVLLAHRRNGAELDSKGGPLRLVIPEERRQARWVRQVKELEIIRVEGNDKP
jgi:DMSO/TMAO reductase YedYZ molybdopterin-dependent catalytic subunit